ncbi:hypothetical protein R3P38DRAFT_3339788 [Favolaschia claudopus]|uniref:Uncharacterized protein n=1 Tax=Favolaschia claudopus TaxID=2862362 RepID=A0AAW0EGM6_9AGAR
MHHINSHYSGPSRYHPSYGPDPSLGRVVSSASSILDQPPPPTLRDILGAYKANGDGDRDMLLAMLNAKAAEDQRLASIAALHRSMLEVYQTQPLEMNGSHHHHYPPKYTPSPPLRDARPQRNVYHHIPSVSRSPPPSHARTSLPSIRAPSPRLEHRRKRARSSHSPPPPRSARRHEPPSDSRSELPPSPYSSSGSDSAGYSPRSRGSMTIGSLLSTGPPRDGSGDELPPSDRAQP